MFEEEEAPEPIEEVYIRSDFTNRFARIKQSNLDRLWVLLDEIDEGG